MYMLALKQVQINLSPNSYIELRKLMDTAMRSNFKYVMFTALIANVVLVAINFKQPGSVIFVTAVIALICLVADFVIIIKGNMPINDVINSWSVSNYPNNWADYRNNWLRIFQYRQISAITAFISLLIGAIFGK